MNTIKMFLYDPETRSFSDQDTARQKCGILNQIMLHFLKLRYKFDYDRDRTHHIDNIVGFTKEITKVMGNDDSSKGAANMMKFYEKELNRESQLRSWSQFLKKNYGLKTRLTDDDFDYAVRKTTKLLALKTKEQKYDHLNNSFPED